MSQKDLESLRSQIDHLNLEILRLINERAAVVEEIGAIKEKQGVNRYDPLRERHMLDLIKTHNNGPLNQMTVDYIFKQIFKTALKQLDSGKKKQLLVSRKEKSEDTTKTYHYSPSPYSYDYDDDDDELSFAYKLIC